MFWFIRGDHYYTKHKCKENLNNLFRLPSSPYFNRLTDGVWAMNNRCVLITGAGGFIGSHLIEYLISRNEDVVGTHHNATTDISRISNKCKLIACDVRSRDIVEKILKQYEPKIIFHLAAQSYPTVSWKNRIIPLKQTCVEQ